MFVLAHVSSTNTSFAGSSPSRLTRHAARLSATSGRPCSAARADFFVRQPQLAQRLADRPRRDRHAEAIPQLDQRRVGLRLHQFGQAVPVDLAAARAAAVARGDVAAALPAPLLEAPHPRRADRELLGGRLGPQSRVAVGQHPLPQVHRIRFHPSHIIKMMVELTAPRPTDTIRDPACGSLGFLVAAGLNLVGMTG
jgi:hypothetical protein